jgi:periplasmic protein TonB
VATKSLLGLSVIFHGALGLLIARIEMQESRAATAIEISEQKKREIEKKLDEPPKPPPEPPQKLAKRAKAAEKPLEAPPPEAAAPLEALPDFGLELSGGIGGIPVAPVATAAQAQRAPTAARAAAASVKRPLAAQAAAPAADGCDEPAAKPRPVNVPQPAYTDRARAAGIEGKVRVELTVDESGRVVNVRVLTGLGYGLDEAAIAAAERASFEPALRCGKPARATFTISMRFSAL